MDLINKKTLEYLADLTRLKLSSSEEEKILKDLENILEYFKELQSLDTSGVEAMSSGIELKSVTREDIVGKTSDTSKGKNDFSDSQDGFLKVPAIF